MRPPCVSVLIPTFARVQLLEEAIWSALRQDYAGIIQVDVFNDCEMQTLAAGDERVRCFNFHERFPTLGAKRQAMLECATHEWVAFLDDDDLWFPWHLSALDLADTHTSCVPLRWWVFKPDDKNAWSHSESGGINFMARRQLLLNLGGFDPKLDRGEDTELRQRLLAGAEQFQILRPSRPSYVYRLDRSQEHQSHHQQQVVADADKRLRQGREPRGCVKLTPGWKRDYLGEARERFPGDVP